MNRFEEVRNRLAEELEIAPEKITLESRLFEDLHADSMNLMNLVTEIQMDYDIDFDDQALKNIKTVADIVKYVEEYLK